MRQGRMKDFYAQYEEIVIKFEKQEKLLKETNQVVKELKNIIKSLNNTIESQNKVIEEQALEILRLKTKNDKDSSNSSKPSSTNGYKKVITNRREKSNRKQGGQKNHPPHTLIKKLDQFMNSGDIEEEIIEINKNEENKHKRYIEKKVIDIKVTKCIKIYILSRQKWKISYT